MLDKGHAERAALDRVVELDDADGAQGADVDNPWRSAGSPVPEGFAYASDTNTEWLDVADLKALLG